jgi:hypothetical protein
MRSDYDIARELMISDRHNIIEKMPILIQMNRCPSYDKGSGLFVKGRIAEYILRGKKGVDVNTEGKDFSYDHDSLTIYVECKSAKNALISRFYKKTHKMVKGRQGIIIKNGRNDSKTEITKEYINEVCDRSSMIVILDTYSLNTFAVATVDPEKLKEIHLDYWTGDKDLKVNIPIKIVDTLIENEEIKTYLKNLTEKELEKAGHELIKIETQEKCAEFGFDFNEVVGSWIDDSESCSQQQLLLFS